MTRVVHEHIGPDSVEPQRSPKRRGRARLKWLGIIFLVFIGVLAATLAVIYFTAPDQYNILLVGSDQRGTERARSDVMIIVSIPKAAPQHITLLTIPRDTKVDDPAFGLQKMTHFYAFGEREENSVLGNITLTKTVIERELNIKLDATAEVTFSSFQQLIDDVGGVTLASTQEHLSGEQALVVVRDRYRSGGDFARTSDQREIVSDLIQRLYNVDFAGQVYGYLTTNQKTRLRAANRQAVHFFLAFILGHLRDLQAPELDDEVLPPGHGTGIYTPEFSKSLYYYELDTEATTQLLDRTLR